MAPRRDYPLSFFWGLVLVGSGIALPITEPDIGSLIAGIVVAALGVWLVRRGWAIAQDRPRRG